LILIKSGVEYKVVYISKKTWSGYVWIVKLKWNCLDNQVGESIFSQVEKNLRK
jgi:hypothetical protein